jgi:glycosyltransferase involved in cell wall biosynthesis
MKSADLHSDTLIIIPAYNEAGTIPNVVTSIRSLYPRYEILVVDDGSTDDTALLAERAGARVISHPFNMGYGVSLQTGYKYAVRKGYSYLCQMDGDGQHDPKGIEKLLAPVRNGSVDIALGSRFLGSHAYHQSVYRSIGICLFRLVLFILSGQRITDPTTGFQAMNRKVLTVFITDIFPSDYPDADVIMLVSILGFKISEVPVTMYAKADGKSMHNNPIKAFYYVFKMLLSMLLTRMRKYSS